MNSTHFTHQPQFNGLPFEKKGFTYKLINAAIKHKLISMETGANCKIALANYINDKCIKWCNENGFNYTINAYKHIYSQNYHYILSHYLYECFSREDALKCLLGLDFHRLYDDAIQFYRKTIDELFVRVKAFELEVSPEMSEIYLTILGVLADMYSFDDRTMYLYNEDMDDSDYTSELTYLTMSFPDLIHLDPLSYLSGYIDSFIVETRILNKFPENMKILIFNEGGYFLANTLYCFAYRTMNSKKPRFASYNNSFGERTMNARRRWLLRCPKEEVFDRIFSFEDIVCFTEDEKEYIRKYLLIKYKTDW